MQFFDVITALTISVILAILVLYVTVVFKKGWLKRNSVESHFLCPNQKCKKIFTEPLWLTDLSKTPPEAYPACPHCSINLNIIPFFGAKKGPQPKGVKVMSSTLKEYKKPFETIQPIEKKTTIEKPTAVRETSESAVIGDASEGLKKPASPQDSKTLPQTLGVTKETSSKPFEKFKIQDGKKHTPNARDCAHFFGYVRSLPKNTPIPDECLGCPWIVECLTTRAEQVEA